MKKSAKDPWANAMTSKNRSTARTSRKDQRIKRAKDPWADVITLKDRSTVRTSCQEQQVGKLKPSEAEPSLTAQISSQEQQSSKLKPSGAKNSSRTLSSAMERLAELVPDAIAVFEEVLEGNGGRDTAARLNAAKTVLRLILSMSSKEPAVVSEQTIPSKEITDEIREQMRQTLFRRVVLGERG